MRALRIVFVSGAMVAVGATLVAVLALGEVRSFTRADGLTAYGPGRVTAIALDVVQIAAAVCAASGACLGYLRARRNARLAKGCCHGCGHQLTPAQETCPECGVERPCTAA